MAFAVPGIGAPPGGAFLRFCVLGCSGREIGSVNSSREVGSAYRAPIADVEASGNGRTEPGTQSAASFSRFPGVRRDGIALAIVNWSVIRIQIRREDHMGVGTILIIVLILILIGALPTWPLQLRLGLLPERRVGPRPAHPDHPPTDRQALR